VLNAERAEEERALGLTGKKKSKSGKRKRASKKDKDDDGQLKLPS
jgi:hypothetical protein